MFKFVWKLVMVIVVLGGVFICGAIVGGGAVTSTTLHEDTLQRVQICVDKHGGAITAEQLDACITETAALLENLTDGEVTD